ncbi:MAG: DUF2017 family protein [Planctomycetota bacterium]
MNPPALEIGPDGELDFRRLPPIYAEILLQLPEILNDTEDEVRKRLFPASYPADPDKEAEWDRLSRPELFALFSSQLEIVSQDLEGLACEPGDRGYRLRLPGSHQNAWIAALNAARHLLASQFSIGEADMDREPDLDAPTDKDIALLKVHLLGYIQGMIVDGAGQ